MSAAAVPGMGWASRGVFQLGKGKTLAIPMSVHASAREKLCALMSQRGISAGIILIKGGDESYQYDTDTENIFRQDSWFNYLFGAKEPGLYGTIDIATGKSTLFIPRLSDEYAIWCGEIYPPSYFVEMYGVDSVLYTDEMTEYLKSKLSTEVQLHVMHGTNSDSGSTIEPPKFNDYELFSQHFNTSVLFHALSTARVTKSPNEIIAMRYCAYVASNAHVKVMRVASTCATEYELEATFLYEIYKNGGCRKAAYTSICACGPNGAVLHYGHAGAPNDRQLQATDMVLLDMGAEYHGYVSDITCSFPLSGKFTADQAAIYTGVLNAQTAVLAAMRPGFSWPDCHKIAEREIIKNLLAIGILVNGTEDELAVAGMGAIFFPHGLGHLIGCDTHDVGGYIEGTPSRHSQPGLKKLRTARILEEGMVLTNEPGCYFIDVLLDNALNNPETAKYINNDVLLRFRKFGGVRLEDVVLVTADGAENLTTCPRTIAEIESVMAGGVWPPASDSAPQLKRKWVKLSAGGQGFENLD